MEAGEKDFKYKNNKKRSIADTSFFAIRKKKKKKGSMKKCKKKIVFVIYICYYKVKTLINNIQNVKVKLIYYE